MANALSTAMSKVSQKPIRIKPSRVGSLHEALGVPQGQKIGAAKVAAATHSKSPNVRKKAQFAANLNC